MTKFSFYKMLPDEELFLLIKDNKSAENEFYARYKERVKSILKNYRIKLSEREDLIQEGMIGLFHAIETFNPGKGVKFTTYSSVCIKNRINNALSSIYNHKKKMDSQVDIEEIAYSSNLENDTITTEISEKLREEIAKLSDLEQNVINAYLYGKSYKIIASELEISVKKVDNILMKIKSRLSVNLLNKNDISGDGIVK